MSRRLSISLACTFTTLVFLCYLVNQRHTVLKFEDNIELDTDILEIFKTERDEIASEMENLIFPNGFTSSLDDLVMEKGGTPIRNLVIATWRTGSSFVGDILKSIPGSYYFFEPLLITGLRRFHLTDYPEANEYVVHHLKKLFSCDFSGMNSYLNLGKYKKITFFHNGHLQEHCNSTSYCQDAKFMSRFCKLFPFITMKTVRLGLDVAQSLLNDRKLNIRILLLVRDPRGTMHSRRMQKFCKVGPECDNPRRLCKDLKEDFEIGRELNRKDPQKFKVLRYEDLAIDLFNKTGDIFRFFGLPFHQNVQLFLETHTKFRNGDNFSTFRNTTSTPFNWMTKMNIENIRNIERVCESALDVWGYKVPTSDIAYSEEKIENVLYKDYQPFQ